MKNLLLIIVVLMPLVIIYFSIAGCASKSKQVAGLVSGKLAECPKKPNCVVSENVDIDTNDVHFIAPYKIDNTVSLDDITQVLLAMGADIIEVQGNYIAATFTSRFFRFVDDFDVRIEHDNKLVHIRSASRIGYSDFGVNRKRAEHFKKALDKQLTLTGPS